MQRLSPLRKALTTGGTEGTEKNIERYLFLLRDLRVSVVNCCSGPGYVRSASTGLNLEASLAGR